MSYLVEQKERTSSPQQAQCVNVIFDTTGYPIAQIPQDRPVEIPEASKNNSLLFLGGLALFAIGFGAFMYQLGASGEAQKAQQQQVELFKLRSGVAELCKEYNK